MSKNESLVTNKLIEKIMAAKTSKSAIAFDKSQSIQNKDCITTSIPALNIALSGEIDGGLEPGLLVIAGPSKHFKSLMMLLQVKAYMDKYPDAVYYFYDSEFGTSKEYFESVGIDTARVIHNPIMSVEQLRGDITNLLEMLTRGDKVIIGVDSIGNLASKKEINDAISGNEAADMTRAKVIKSLFRIVTPYLTSLDIPMITIAHTYQTMEMFSKATVSGGTGVMYSASDVWIMGRQQEKDSKEITGYSFVINIEKSRHVKEKSKIALKVLHSSGLYKYSGLLEIALDGGFIIKPSMGWYALATSPDNKFREKDTSEILKDLITDEEFKAYVRKKYKLAGGSNIVSDHDDTLDTTEE